MKKTIPWLLTILLGSFGSCAWAQVTRTLWITDDVTSTVYEVRPDGTLLSSFPVLISEPFPDGFTFGISPSEITVDRSNDTLWIVAENPGRIVNFSQEGTQLAEAILTEPTFGAIGPEGIAHDLRDDSLWIVDDTLPGHLSTVYHINKEGRLIAPQPFPTNAIQPDLVSPQGIAVDPLRGTLWIVDNSADRIYNLTRSGRLLRIFDSPGSNPQGIAIDKWNGTLWTTDRDTATIYNLSVRARLRSSFPSATYDHGSMNPTGVAATAFNGFTLLLMVFALLFARSLNVKVRRR